MEKLETSITRSDMEASEYAKYLISEKRNYSVSRVSFIDGFTDVDLPVAIAYRPNSRVLSQSGGKGVSRTQSLISALMESYECDVAEKYKPDINIVTEKELTEQKRNHISPKILSITLPSYTSNKRIDWCNAKNCITGEDLLVPFHAISLDFTLMAEPRTVMHMQLTSNGLASGKTTEQATVSALYEVIERHSITSHEIRNIETSKPVDIMSIPCSIHKNLIDKIVSSEIRICIYDITVWDEFPTYACHIVDAVGFSNVGWGCHVDPDISLARAITEANQARTIQISGSREDMNKYDYFNIKREEDNTADTNNTQYVDYRSRIMKDSPNSIQISKLISNYAGAVPVSVCIDQRKDMSAVRVIVPRLHGYNYPAYRSTISRSFKDSILDFKMQATHKPAAG